MWIDHALLWANAVILLIFATAKWNEMHKI